MRASSHISIKALGRASSEIFEGVRSLFVRNGVTPYNERVGQGCECVALSVVQKGGARQGARRVEHAEMKWIVLAGSSNTGKTYTLSEVVIELVKRGAILTPPSAMPVWIPSRNTYADASYELSFASKRVYVFSQGDYPSDIDTGFSQARAAKADVLISASRSKAGCGHLAKIDARTSTSIETYFIATFKHDVALQQRIRINRVDQIIKMI